MGYYLAGFAIVGVDHEEQPNYPFPVVQADALEYVAAHGHEYDVIHASPPCQAHTTFRALNRKRYGRVPDHPDLIAATRQALIACGKPWVIENVQNAPLDRGAVMLCG